MIDNNSATSALTVDNFLFTKEPLGFGEPFETNRDAIPKVTSHMLLNIQFVQYVSIVTHETPMKKYQ